MGNPHSALFSSLRIEPTQTACGSFSKKKLRLISDLINTYYLNVFAIPDADVAFSVAFDRGIVVVFKIYVIKSNALGYLAFDQRDIFKSFPRRNSAIFEGDIKRLVGTAVEI